MKVLQGLLLLLALNFVITSCNSDAADTKEPVQQAQVAPTTPTEKKTATKTEQTTPATQQTQPAKPGIDPNSDEAAKARAAMVEKTEEIKEAPVDDTAIDYKKLAASICQCGAKYKGKDANKGSVHVSSSNTDYQAEVDCALQAKNDMSSGEISRKKLVGALKNECSDVSGKYVMRVMMSLAK